MDAVVFGSGVGGCVAAARLAAAGLRVAVLERNPVTGGILASYHRDGFKLDTGSHLVSRGSRGPLGVAVRTLGVDPPTLLTHPRPLRSRGIFEIAAPARRRGLLGTALEAVRTLGLPLRDALALGRLLLWVFTLSPRELRAWDRRTLDELVRAHTDHPAAWFLFSFMASIFFVLPPWEVSAGEALRCLRALLRDYRLSYVEGGMDEVARSLLARVTRGGGAVHTDARVVSLRRRDRRWRVATAEGLELEAPLVACNVAPQEVPALLAEVDAPPAWLARLRAVVPSGNAHQLKVGLRRPLVAEGCLIGGVSRSGLTVADLSFELMERTVADIAEGRVTDPLALYVPVPTNFDPRLAPPGHQLLLASVYGPTRESPADPPARWREAALGALASVVPGLGDELLFVDFAPAPRVGAWMGRRSNGAIANAQRPGQVGEDRLPVSTPLPGLFLCGDGAGGWGIGTELAAASGDEAARAMLAVGR